MLIKLHLISFVSLLTILATLSSAQRASDSTQARPSVRRRGRGPTHRNPTARRGQTRRRTRFCQKIMVPMCKGQVGYQFTRLPNQYGHRTQAEVMEALEPMWPYMDMDCSPNFRVTACSTFVPKCIERRRKVLPPCRQTCIKAKRECRSAFTAYKTAWPQQLNCSRLPFLRKGQKGVCVVPSKRRKTRALTETMCVANQVPMCANLTFSQAFIPNMFWQSSLILIGQELRQYRELVDTNCHQHIRFFLCGIYLPFCMDAATEFAVPCRSVCEEVRRDCEAQLMRVYGIHWPGKLQCHRYPESATSLQQCVHPSDTTIENDDDNDDDDEEEQ